MVSKRSRLQKSRFNILEILTPFNLTYKALYFQGFFCLSHFFCFPDLFIFFCFPDLINCSFLSSFAFPFFLSFFLAALPCLSALYPLTLPLFVPSPWFPAPCCFVLSQLLSLSWLFSSSFPFSLLLCPVSLRFTLSLCRCLCLLLGFQPLAVSFCLSSCLCPGFCLFLSFFLAALPCLSALYPLTLPLSVPFLWFSAPCRFLLSLSCRFLPFFASFSSFFRPFCFRKTLTNNTFTRTPSEPSPTTSQPSHCCRYVTTS